MHKLAKMSDTGDYTTMPSQLMPWRKYYEEGAYERALDLPKGETFWSFLEKRISTVGTQYDAYIYFGRHYSRRDFIDMTYHWARIFKGMGVKPDEMVVLFAPFSPDVAAIMCGLNVVGAAPLMPNLGASPECIDGTVHESRFAIVLDVVYDRIKATLNRKQFEHIIILRVSDCMPQPIKTLTQIKFHKLHHQVMTTDPRMMTKSEAERRFGKYQGKILEPDEVLEPYVANRDALVCSSAGTTQAGKAKLIETTNEGIVNMITCGMQSRTGRFNEGERYLNIIPPFVSTSLFVLWLCPLYTGGTIIMDPTLTVDNFQKLVFKFRPEVTLMPGKGWEFFFYHVEELIRKGKRPDLSFFKTPIMGGEGCTPEEFCWMNRLMKECGATTEIIPGYGMSEGFSVMTVDLYHYDYEHNHRDAIQSGIPFPGFVAGIFDDNGNELPIGQQGELWIKSPTMMKGYYGRPELTARVMAGGWLHTGDWAEMDENGQLFCYGRMKNAVLSPKGERIFTFQIANYARHDKAVRLALCNDMTHDECQLPPHLVMHLILYPDCTESHQTIIERLDDSLKQILPEGLTILGYKIQNERTLRLSHVIKTDKNSYKKEYDGYFRPQDGKLIPVTINPAELGMQSHGHLL